MKMMILYVMLALSPSIAFVLWGLWRNRGRKR